MTDTEPKKRGRKSKKVEQIVSEQVPTFSIINTQVEEEEESIQLNLHDCNPELEPEQEQEQEQEPDKVVTKKRGRKPKGGKIIQQVVSTMNSKENKPNVTLSYPHH
jgi:hypothetical protein